MLRFYKMHGAGNDFVIINDMLDELPREKLGALAKHLCAQRTSIGADGMMVVVPPVNGGDFGMLFYNSDGSEGEMCGNGARCICRYGFETGLAPETIQKVETVSGMVIGERIDHRRYRIRLNDPSVIDLHRCVEVNGKPYDCAYIELGVPGLPHAVVQIENLKAYNRDELRELGRALRWAKEFPKGANVNFVEKVGENELDIITFERGVEDFTLACGTGSGSAVTALTLLGLVSGNGTALHAPGGELSVTVTTEEDGSAHDVYLTGPTNIVAIGEITDEDLR